MGANEEKGVVEIDLFKLVRYYLEKWWVIALCAVVLAGTAFVYTARFVTPLYRANVTVYVNSTKNVQNVEYVTGSTLSAAQQLVSTYVNMIRSDTVLERVIEKENLTLSADDIRQIMSASQIAETEMFKVTITYPDPQEAARIANAIAEVAPGMIAEFVDGSSTKIIDYAKVPQQPSSPSVSKNTVMGALLGCILAGLALTVRYLFDFRLQDEGDIAQYFDAPVLSIIPAYDQPSSKKHGYEYGALGRKSARGGKL